MTNSTSATAAPPGAEDTIYSSQNEAQKRPADAKPGVWIGIDLGTSFSSSAIWSIDDGRAKLLRVGGPTCHNLAAPPKYKGSNYKKAGKSCPSAALLLSGVGAVEQNIATNVKSSKGSKSKRSVGERRLAAATSQSPEAIRDSLEDVQSCEGIIDPSTSRQDISALIGYAASSAIDRSFQQTLEEDKSVGNNAAATSAASSTTICHEQLSQAYVTSVKRVLGITKAQAHKELVEDEEFVKSLPFRIEVVDERRDGDKDGPAVNNSADMAASGNTNTDETTDEGVLVCIPPFPTSPKNESADTGSELKLRPTQLAALLLRSIRLEAQQSLRKYKLNAPGSNNGQDNTVRNCVVGVPAHFGRIQRKAVQNACRLAGFDGEVSTITESTAAAMAYGVFVSPKLATNADDAGVAQNKIILVFDMGGGTTDVTICEMSSDASRRFKVISTAGDRRLGGDDLDEKLVQYVWTQIQNGNDVSSMDANEHRSVREKCRSAKEELCGNGDDPPPAQEVVIDHRGGSVKISQEQFDEIIRPFVDRGEGIVEEALAAYARHIKVRRNRAKVDEVVLVGGSSRVPAIRNMLTKKFSEVPELCYSIKPEAAVSQGAAVQAAILSGCVPMHELRSAMMLDSLPHAIGVLTSADNGEEAYIPILRKDQPLPAVNAKPFFLADVDQPGITIVAVEDVGDEFPLQRLGEFTFLLHRLTDGEKASVGGRRKVEVGFVVDESGKFTVSFFDELDPDHQTKKRRYLEMKRKAGELTGEANEDTAGDVPRPKTREEVLLNLAIAAVFFVYIFIKLAFAEPTEDGSKIL